MAAADVTYERHVVGSRSMLELRQLQDSFHVLLSQAHPDHIAAFFCWLDLKVAQFKVFGGSLSPGLLMAFCNVVIGLASAMSQYFLFCRGVRNVINCRPGTRINVERVPGYPLKIHNSTITVIESCWSGRHLANN